MVVLNICKKIKPLCLSKKLGLYISNLDNCPYENWREYINEEFINAHKIAKITSEKFECSFLKFAYEHYKKHFPLIAQNHSSFDDAMIGDIIESTDRHNYVECKSGACAVDGGHDYLRRSFKEKDCYIDLSVTKELQKTQTEEYRYAIRNCKK